MTLNFEVIARIFFTLTFSLFVGVRAVYAQKDCCREKAIQRFSFLKKIHNPKTISHNPNGTFALHKPYTYKDKISYPQHAYDLAITYYHINKDSAIYYYREATSNEHDPDEAAFMLHSYFLNRTNHKLDEIQTTRLNTLFANKYGHSAYKGLIFDIQKMHALDQSVRAFGLICDLDTQQNKDIRHIDSTNLIAVKKLYREHGYPTISMIGAENQKRFFILIQHADRDVAFQKKVLDEMKLLLPKAQVNKEDYAYLYDRVLTATEGVQYYGTQSGNFSIRDSAHVDERRAELNLPPISTMWNSTVSFERHTETTFAFPEIFFDINQHKINNKSADSLNVVVKWMKKNPATIIEISGFADDSGDPKENMALSHKRAKEIAHQLQLNCIQPRRLSIKAMGAISSTKDGKEQSRKVQIKIVK